VDDSFWASLRKGDLVIGTLPMHLAAQACEITGKPFGFFSMFVPPEERGNELTVKDMESFGAEISWFEVAGMTAPKA